jgi:hypothetical protein
MISDSGRAAEVWRHKKAVSRLKQGPRHGAVWLSAAVDLYICSCLATRRGHCTAGGPFFLLGIEPRSVDSPARKASHYTSHVPHDRGEAESAWYVGHLYQPWTMDDAECGEVGSGNRRTGREPLSIKNPTWPDLASKPATNGLNRLASSPSAHGLCRMMHTVRILKSSSCLESTKLRVCFPVVSAFPVTSRCVCFSVFATRATQTGAKAASRSPASSS